MASRSRLPEAAVSGSSRRRRPRQRPLRPHPLPQQREAREDSVARHRRASNCDWVRNHHATTLLCLELQPAGGDAAGDAHSSLFLCLG
ncbi:hypothetical protein DEO72_LG10g1544 [Vigna unguiculata]|uniref:Uncharacterized protein n=1 Tax=Vigna unguiculata TaxID=3917 RepID=A0A4D6N9B0_VIGUN|nr:hypothetical protein DEO72_LG9g991 [Vigna unguiculata]QCE10316.1 hypothetical protein DEO72_LG10g1544 [Vigna unguiculata]